MFFNKILILFSISTVLNALECGVQKLSNTREDRVVNGNDTVFGQFPWNVLVLHGTKSVQVSCAGVLISASWALSVVHCFRLENSKLSEYQLRFGEFNYRYWNEPIDAIIRYTFQFFPHPHYKSTLEGSDIALLKFTPVRLQPHIQTICLPTVEDDKSIEGKLGTFIGWGRTYSNDKYSPILQQVELPVIPNSACQRALSLGDDYRNITSNFLCAGFIKGKWSACHGEGGAPLQFKRENGTWFVAGLLTTVHGYCDSLSMFTRIAHFMPWIRRTMQSESTE